MSEQNAWSPAPLRTRNDLVHPPKVSVAMITYNHEPYVAQAIESVLDQETDFPVELIIGEDASTDGTRTVVEEYARRYPTVIKLLPVAPNLGMHANFRRVLGEAEGEYIALLEGDDYWSDPLKLSRQLEKFVADDSVILCGHRTVHFNAAGEVICFIPGLDEEVPSEGNKFMVSGCNVHTSSMLFRNIDLISSSSILYDARNLWVDYTLKLLLADRGRIAFCKETMSAYRAHTGGISHRFNDELEKWLTSKIYLLEKFGQETQGRNCDFVNKQIAIDQQYLAKSKEGRVAKAAQAVYGKTRNALRKAVNILRTPGRTGHGND